MQLSSTQSSLLRLNFMSQLRIATNESMKCRLKETALLIHAKACVPGPTFLSPFSCRRLFTAHNMSMCQTDQLLHTCDIDAEPLQRYCRGGYHPVKLGDILGSGRYKILHKLGWGGFSTVWAARDQRSKQYVAVKIAVARQADRSREIKVLRSLSTNQTQPSDTQNVVSMLDNFQVNGPNGNHECIVLELLGPSIRDLLESRFGGERLPGKVARSVARQTLIGLDFLHKRKIGHGDLHIGNLSLTIPKLQTLSESQFLQSFGDPETAPVKREDGNPLDSSVPEYIVRATSYRPNVSPTIASTKIVDLGESFAQEDRPSTLHTPLPVRAPEVVFQDLLDYRVDMWSMGCLLFELVVGQPPFDSIMTTPAILVRQMREMASDDLPERWKKAWDDMQAVSPGEASNDTLQSWLEEMYFDGERREDFNREDIRQVGRLIAKMLRFEPGSRASAEEILHDPWFDNAEQ